MYDVIGTLYTPGEHDTEGNEITAPVPLPGWHVNSPYPVEGWEQYLVTPNTPRRVFAGHQTVCYRFPSEEAYEAVNPTEPGVE